jgi:uroporphyrinogen decarboxylase
MATPDQSGTSNGTGKRERVMAALKGDAVDRVPITFWAHNYAKENSATDLAEETLRVARLFDWDFLKPQCRAQCFAEMWGLTYRPSTERTVHYTVTHLPVSSPADFARLQPVDPRTGALGEQLQALDLIRSAVGPDVPIVWTVFSPIMVARFLAPEDQFLGLVRADPAQVERGLAAITETMAEYARACVEHGADGLFYATNLANRELLSEAEVRRFQRPFDLPILQAVADAPFNILHLCGSGIWFDDFADYPVRAFSWAATDPSNPSLSEVHRRGGRAVVGGVRSKPSINDFSPAQVAEYVDRAIQQMDGRWLLLAGDCSVDPNTREELLFAARDAARRRSA